MTELTIIPKVSDKTARFKGTIAAGEHVAVTIKGGAEWIGGDEGANLTLRVIDLITKRTLAVFPRPPEVMDEGAEPDAWEDSGEDLTCTLNLNTTRMVNAARHMLRVPVIFVLGDTDVPRTLYFCDQYEVEYWPERIGDDVPYDLDAWPKQIDEWMELVDEWTDRMDEFGETLSGHVENGGIHVTAEQKAAWTAKQNAIADLEAIRVGAAKGATAIQEHQDISGKADLVGGKVPQSQLPSYVDDVLEFAAFANFPSTGEEGKIYVAKDTNKMYRWSGTQYVQVGGSDIPVDSALSTTSENPVQNKVVTAAVNAKCTVAEAVAEVTRVERNAVYTVTFDPYDDGETTVEFVISDIEWGMTDDDVLTISCKVDGEEVSVSSERHVEEVNVPLGGSIYATAAYEQAPGAWEYVDGNLGILTKHVAVSYVDGQNAHGLARLVDLPTKTSDLVNDGADGAHPFISQHQQLTPVYGGNGDVFSDWVVIPDNDGLLSVKWLEDSGVGDGWFLWDTEAGNYVSYEAKGNAQSTSLSWTESDADYTATATRTENPIIGYTLGTQSTKPLQPQGDYYQKPQGGIPASDMASGVQTSLGKADTAVQPAGIAALMPMYNFTQPPVMDDLLTVLPYTVTTYTADSTAAAFEIAVGALPTGVTGKARDCILVIDCTATGAVAPTVTWGTHFHPRTDTATDLAIVEAGKRAVFYISEYVTGEFAVGGWTETAGGSGT